MTVAMVNVSFCHLNARGKLGAPVDIAMGSASPITGFSGDDAKVAVGLSGMLLQCSTINFH
jgi:hypothetical protein